VIAHSENFVILACTVLIQSQSVTDRWDRQTDTSTMAMTRKALYAVARKKVLTVENNRKTSYFA